MCLVIIVCFVFCILLLGIDRLCFVVLRYCFVLLKCYLLDVGVWFVTCGYLCLMLLLFVLLFSCLVWLF